MFARSSISSPNRHGRQPLLAWGKAMLVAGMVAAALPTPALVAAENTPDRPRTVRLLLGLVWEGRDLEAYNLEALKRFRSEYSDLQIVHFISPAYFLNSRLPPEDAAARIRGLIKPNDRIGLSLAGWQSLAAKAGVIFRGGPTFWGHAIRPTDCAVATGKDCGADVPVHVYPPAELDKLVATALDVLEGQGFGRVQGLQTSGWVASPELLDVAAQRGVRYDFSAVAAEMIAKRVVHYPLYGWVKGLWPAVTPHTQPHVIVTRNAELTEFPQSLAAIDYLSVGDVDVLFKEYAELARRDPARELTFPLTFYQETAYMTLPRLTKALQAVFDTASRQGVSLAPLELPGMEPPTASLSH